MDTTLRARGQGRRAFFSSLAALLVAGCGDGIVAFDPELADLSWLFVEAGDAFLSEYPAGTKLDYSHEGGSAYLKIARDGTFEVAFLNCEPSDFVYVQGTWTATAPGEIRLDATDTFGYICCPQAGLVVRETGTCGELEVRSFDKDGNEDQFFDNPNWSLGRPCLVGCCTFENGVCDPTVVHCDQDPCP